MTAVLTLAAYIAALALASREVTRNPTNLARLTASAGLMLFAAMLAANVITGGE